MRITTILFALFIMTGCTTNPNVGQPVQDQYGYRYLQGETCFLGFMCSVTTDAERAAHNARQRAEENRQQRAYERALRKVKRSE